VSRLHESAQSQVSHDHGDNENGLYRIYKITRNIVVRNKILATVFVSIFTFADEPRDYGAFMSSCMELYEYNIFSLLDISVDWKRYECMFDVFVGRLSQNVVKRDTKYNHCSVTLMFAHTYLICTQSIAAQLLLFR
jgi:hypothetical protein